MKKINEEELAIMVDDYQKFLNSLESELNELENVFKLSREKYDAGVLLNQEDAENMLLAYERMKEIGIEVNRRTDLVLDIDAICERLENC